MVAAASDKPRCYWCNVADCDHLGNASRPMPSYVPRSVAQDLVSAVEFALRSVGHDLSCPAYMSSWTLSQRAIGECSCFRSAMLKACAVAQKWGVR